MLYESLKKILQNLKIYNPEELDLIAKLIVSGELVLNEKKEFKLTPAGEALYEDAKFDYNLEQKRINFKGLRVYNRKVKPVYRRKLKTII